MRFTAQEVQKMIPNSEVMQVFREGYGVIDGLVIREENPVPNKPYYTVYPQYIEADSLPQLVERIYDMIERAPGCSMNIKELYDWKNVKNDVVGILLSGDNKTACDEAGFANIEWLDMILCVGVKKGDNMMRITNDHIRDWGVEKKEVFDSALTNMQQKVRVMDLAEYMSHKLGVELTEDDLTMMRMFPMTMITNQEFNHGAAYIVPIVSMLAKSDCDRILIPSSIHEWLVVDDDGRPMNDWNDMIGGVNGEHVRPEERLSDHAYKLMSNGIVAFNW